MSKKHGGKLPPFVPLLRSTLKAPAWKALSPGARAAFVALKANYSTNMQNAVYLSARSGAKELGVHTHTALKLLRELEHYGFIVNVEKGSLGVFGYAKAPKYRLTDWYYAGQPPTADYQNWDGVLFEPKKQNPVRSGSTPRAKKPHIGKSAEPETVCATEPHIEAPAACATEPHITSLTTQERSSGALAGHVPPVAGIGHNAGPPLDDWSIPPFLRREGASR